MSKTIQTFRRFAVPLFLSVGLTTLFAAASSAPQTPRKYAKFEIGLWGGVAMARTLGATTYQDTWSSLLQTTISERTAIDVRARDSARFGGSFTYFFHPHTGFQFLTGYSRGDAPNSSRLDFTWTAADGTTDRRSMDNSDTTGRLRVIPLCLNFVERLTFGLWNFEFSVGAAHYWNEIEQRTVFGYTVAKISVAVPEPDEILKQDIDALAVGLTIPKKAWTAWGADLGVGMNIQTGRLFGLKAEVRYFYCPEKTLLWTPRTGAYDGIFSTAFRGEPFDEDSAAALSQAGHDFELKVKPSFVQIAVGIVLTLGR